MDTVIDQKAFRAQLRAELGKFDAFEETPDLSQLLPSLQKIILEESLVFTYGNQTKAARMLNLNRGTLRTRLRHFGLHA
ncbi:hypothetical protein V9N52_004320 [Vibrio navarrensis]